MRTLIASIALAALVAGCAIIPVPVRRAITFSGPATIPSTGTKLAPGSTCYFDVTGTYSCIAP